MAWNMVLDETGMSTWGWKQNALINVDQRSGAVAYNPEYYVFKHLNHFVKPGARRLALAGGSDEVLAFRNPDGAIVVVAASTGEGKREFEIAFGSAISIRATLAAHSFNSFVFEEEFFAKPSRF